MKINEDDRLCNLIAKCLAYGRKVGIVSDNDNIACLDLLMRKATSWSSSEDFLSTLESEKPVPNDLEEAAKKYAHCPYTDDDGNFYEDAIDGTAYRDFIAGAKWQKSQMLKDAVEGRIGLLGFHNAVYIKEPKWTNIIDMFNEGDKVRIIICKKEDGE